MQRDREFLLDILEAARLARSYLAGISKAQFLGDVQRQDAVIRRLEIVGEAARRISPETRAVLPGLPWKPMIGMRNVMIHEYDDVDLETVWNTAENDIPRIIETIEPLLQDSSNAS